MQLVDRIRARSQERPLMIMGHVVVGYPDMGTCLDLVDAMVHAGVDLIELQIPFSEPLADGPVIAGASLRALAGGVTVDACLEFATRVSRAHSIPFLFMSYYNILCQRGIRRFARDASNAGVAGAIVPDCPLEESEEYVAAMRGSSVAPIFLFSPRTPDERLRALGCAGDGLVYVVARKGVTGKSTELSADLTRYLERCRAATTLPLAVGFGLKSKADVQFIAGKAEIAVVGSQALTLLDEGGVPAVRQFLSGLRSDL
jgi:tryptophan synthase alpha chain